MAKNKSIREKLENQEGYGSLKSVLEGAEEIVDGVINIVKGLFKIIAFSLITAFDGFKQLFTMGKKKLEKSKKK